MLISRIKKIYLFRPMLIDLVIKDVRGRYAGSRLGIWWAIANPLLLALSINFVFTKVFSINIPNYTFFVLAGILPWFLFSTAVTEATNVFIIYTRVLKQLMFPREFVVFSSVISACINFFLGLIFILPFFLYFNHKVAILLPLLLLVVILYLFFLSGICLLFAVINVNVRDFTYLLNSLLMVWFWVTPVFYSIESLPMQFRIICLVNPISWYVIACQEILIKATVPSILTWSVMFLISIICFMVGYVVFVKNEANILKKI